MSKAVLVLDMPSSCIGCNFLHCEIEENKEYCEAREIRKQVDLEKEEKPDWCPLKPIPEHKEENHTSEYEDIKNEGFNACIDELLADKE